MKNKKKYNVLYGKNCLITGSTGGLGRELSILFAKMGINVFLTATKNQSLIQLKKKIINDTNNSHISYQSADLTKLSDIKKLIKKIRNEFGTIDILVNCAGIFSQKLMLSSLLDDFDTSFAVNVKAPYIFCNEFGNEMVKKKWGRIVNVGSSAAYNGIANQSIYCATKYALRGFSSSIVQELKKSNVRVFFVSPGTVQTKMGKKVSQFNKSQKYETFIQPSEIAKFILDLIQYDNQLFVEDVRVGRIRNW